MDGNSARIFYVLEFSKLNIVMEVFLLFLLLSVFTPLELCCYQVLGNAKGAVAVVISILLFKNPVTFIGIGGYTMTVMGVIAYGEAKRRLK